MLLSPSLHTLHRGLITLSHLPTTTTPATRLLHVTQQLRAVLSSLPPTAQLHTAVESYLLSFTAQRFQTRHLFQLAAFNSLVQCQLWHLTGQRDWPAVVNVNSARSRFGLKGEVKDGKGGRRVSDVKGVVWRWVDERLRQERDEATSAGAAGAADVEWRRKRDGSVHASMYDISDAYLIALTAAMDRKQQQGTETIAVDETTVRAVGSSGEESERVDEALVSSRASTSKKLRVRKVRKTSAVIVNSSIISDSVQGQKNQRKNQRRRVAAAE